MNKLLSVWLVLLLFTAKGMAQSDSTDFKTRLKPSHWIVPSFLITTGTVTMLDSDADEFFLNNLEVREERNENFVNFSNHADDYLQHMPSATAFMLSICGVKGKNNLRNQSLLYLKSELVTLSIVYGLKYSVGESRPDTGVKNSFPSGHTAQAFTAATFLSKEYGHKSIWISIGAYSAATTVGVFRMLNNRHWVSDVLVGSGIGIFSTHLVYYLHKTEKRKSSLVKIDGVSPFFSQGCTGLSLNLKL